MREGTSLRSSLKRLEGHQRGVTDPNLGPEPPKTSRMDPLVVKLLVRTHEPKGVRRRLTGA